ncbi:MAG TPA: FecR domain-containing protein, partial [Luteolibacter sp.]
MSAPSPDRLDELLCRLVDELLSEAEATELEIILLESPEARERYRLFSTTHLMLAAGHHESSSVSQLPAKRWSLTPFSMAAAAVALLAAGLTIWQSWAPQPVRSVAAEELEKPVLAVVARADGAVWDQSAPANGGTTLQSAAVSLTQGTLVLELIGGQTVTLRAPARFQLINDREMTLLAGDASLRINGNKTPYVIQVPGGAVVDLGTEFSVNVAPNGISDVHVFEGMASA